MAAVTPEFSSITPLIVPFVIALFACSLPFSEITSVPSTIKSAEPFNIRFPLNDAFAKLPLVVIISVDASPNCVVPFRLAAPVAVNVVNVPVGAETAAPLEMFTPELKVVFALTVSVSVFALPIVTPPLNADAPVNTPLAIFPLTVILVLRKNSKIST